MKKRVVVAYHGSPVPIRKFDRRFSADGVFWFSEDKQRILGGESGAVGHAFLMTCNLSVHKTAGWDEYDKFSIDELDRDGYDSVHLDDDWIIFDAKNIKVVGIQQVSR